MADTIDEDDVQRFDNRVPADLKTEREVKDYVQSNFDFFSDKAKQEFADRIAERREAEGGATGLQIGSGVGDYYFDAEAGQWRDSETGRFVQGPEDG